MEPCIGRCRDSTTLLHRVLSFVSGTEVWMDIHILNPPTILTILNQDNHRISDIVIAATSLTSLWTGTLSIRLFYIPSRASSCKHSYPTILLDLTPAPFSVSSLSQRLFSLGCPPITSIPCRLISTRETNNWDYVICILAT
jgi:hypothetical protein